MWYDHDRDAEASHHVTEEGLHRDVYRDGVKIDSVEVSLPIPTNEGVEYADEDFRENVERFIQEVRTMARSDRQEGPVSDEEFASMPERISQHFDHVRERLDQDTDDKDS